MPKIGPDYTQWETEDGHTGNRKWTLKRRKKQESLSHEKYTFNKKNIFLEKSEKTRY